jgi:hypothetical protein
MMTATQRPTWEVTVDAKRFFADVKTDDGTEKRMFRLTTAVVVVSIPLRSGAVDKVAFMKSSRGRQYRDSRGKRVSRKGRGEFDDTTNGIAPLYLSADECQAELKRLLDDSYEGERAFQALNV